MCRGPVPNPDGSPPNPDGSFNYQPNELMRMGPVVFRCRADGGWDEGPQTIVALEPPAGASIGNYREGDEIEFAARRFRAQNGSWHLLS